MTEKFSFDTIKNFDQHILASVPNYDVLFNSILILSDYFVTNDKVVYDIGCSTGKLLKALDEKYKEMQIGFVGYDNSKHLLPESTDTIKFFERDLNQRCSFENACLVFSIFTLQFLSREGRDSLVFDVYNGLNKGGAFIVTEKVYAPNGQVQDIFTSSYYDYKKQTFTEKQILDKEVDLRKILKPNTSSSNIGLLEIAGFRVYPFFKYFNFEGYLCIK
jgi:tRNA (cmo5U34)-methyltransferase